MMITSYVELYDYLKRLNKLPKNKKKKLVSESLHISLK